MKSAEQRHEADRVPGGPLPLMPSVMGEFRMRAYEYHHKHGMRYLNDLLEAKRKSLGLLCSFMSRVPLGSSGLYFDINEMKREFQTLCSSLDVDFHIVGINQNSLDWLDEVYKVILGSHMVVVDVSDPRPNVLYEPGVACSLRSYESVIISKHISSTFDSSEVKQLQILSYGGRGTSLNTSIS